MKGSQYCLIEAVNHNSQKLNDEIISHSSKLLNEVNSSLEIQWISPLKADQCKEYRDDFLQKLGISNKVIERSFWPRRGPVWDGLAKAPSADGKEIILLIEAKAHIDEMTSELKSSSPDSTTTIKETLKRIRAKYMISEQHANVWEKKYYQLANRLAFLDYMTTELELNTYLVLLNFTEDETHIKTSKNTFLLHYKEVFKEMGLTDCSLLDHVIVCYI